MEDGFFQGDGPMNQDSLLNPAGNNTHAPSLKNPADSPLIDKSRSNNESPLASESSPTFNLSRQSSLYSWRVSGESSQYSSFSGSDSESFTGVSSLYHCLRQAGSACSLTPHSLSRGRLSLGSMKRPSKSRQAVITLTDAVFYDLNELARCQQIQDTNKYNDLRQKVRRYLSFQRLPSYRETLEQEIEPRLLELTHEVRWTELLQQLADALLHEEPQGKESLTDLIHRTIEMVCHSYRTATKEHSQRTSANKLDQLKIKLQIDLTEKARITDLANRLASLTSKEAKEAFYQEACENCILAQEESVEVQQEVLNHADNVSETAKALFNDHVHSPQKAMVVATQDLDLQAIDKDNKTILDRAMGLKDTAIIHDYLAYQAYVEEKPLPDLAFEESNAGHRTWFIRATIEHAQEELLPALVKRLTSTYRLETDTPVSCPDAVWQAIQQRLQHKHHQNLIHQLNFFADTLRHIVQSYHKHGELYQKKLAEVLNALQYQPGQNLAEQTTIAANTLQQKRIIHETRGWTIRPAKTLRLLREVPKKIVAYQAQPQEKRPLPAKSNQAILASLKQLLVTDSERQKQLKRLKLAQHVFRNTLHYLSNRKLKWNERDDKYQAFVDLINQYIKAELTAEQLFEELRQNSSKANSFRNRLATPAPTCRLCCTLGSTTTTLAKLDQDLKNFPILYTLDPQQTAA